MTEGFRRQAIAWREVEDFIAERYPGPAPHFIEWHVCMSLNAGADRAEARKRLDAVRDREAAGVLPTAGVLAMVCEGFGAFADGRYAETVRLLEAARNNLPRLGGSGAQRRIIAETLRAARKKMSA
jgi:hypothetical protein